MVIFGRESYVEVFVSEDFYEIMCQSEFSLRVENEMIYTTTADSGLFEEKTIGDSEAFCTVTGLTSVENDNDHITFFYLTQESIRRQEQQLRIRFVDEETGDKKVIYGTALIVSSEIGTNSNDFGLATLNLEFTGGIEVKDDYDPVTGGKIAYADVWDTTAGQNYLDNVSRMLGYSISGKTLIEVVRSGLQYDFIGNNLTPGNRQCSFDTTTNRLIFQDNFLAGETVWIVFTF